MKEISSGAKRIARSLFTDDLAQAEFLNCFAAESAGRSAVQFIRPIQAVPAWVGEAIPWGLPGSYFVIDSRAAALDPIHTDGHCYLLDSSSVFMASTASVLVNQKIGGLLDVCASPGGKSIVLGSVLHPTTQVANEVIKKRLGSLHGNLQRCGMSAVKIVSLDTGQMSMHLGADFDLVVVDAPCSGQSLEMRGEKSPGCFLDVTVNKCAMRQRRILANSSACVSEGGHLLYSTCTFSYEENEKVLEWFLKQHPQFAAVEVPLLTPYLSARSDFPSYRLFPQSGFGSGGFSCLLKRTE